MMAVNQSIPQGQALWGLLLFPKLCFAYGLQHQKNSCPIGAKFNWSDINTVT